MRAAIAAAEVGDEQRREDPTVLALERRVAALLGQEDAVFLPTATMANQIAVRCHAQPGDELLAEEHSHVLVAELGGAAAHSGVVSRGLPGRAGRFTAEQVRAAVRPATMHAPVTRLVWVENTHNASGGRVWPPAEVDELRAVCDELGLALHLDGARLLNAAVALRVDPAALGRPFDTVTLCLSKGLGCPLGALLVGPEGTIGRARRFKHLFGGAMRQAGIVAAAGLYALDHHVERLADDHARARRLAEAWRAAGLPVAPEQVETNVVQLDVGALGLGSGEALALLAEAGVALSATPHAGVLRAVTHLDVGDEDVERAAELVPDALARAAAGRASR
jgi:threonine aldolase